MIEVQTGLGKETQGPAMKCLSEEGGERRAPNGRIAILVDGLWAGYLCEESAGSRGGGTRDMALFDVEELADSKLKITFRSSCPKPHKKSLNKRIHHEREIRMFEATTTSGDRCQLFTL